MKRHEYRAITQEYTWEQKPPPSHTQPAHSMLCTDVALLFRMSLTALLFRIGSWSEWFNCSFQELEARPITLSKGSISRQCVPFKSLNLSPQAPGFSGSADPGLWCHDPSSLWPSRHCEGHALKQAFSPQ